MTPQILVAAAWPATAAAARPAGALVAGAPMRLRSDGVAAGLAAPLAGFTAPSAVDSLPTHARQALPLARATR